jgi:hypothetical protein
LAVGLAVFGYIVMLLWNALIPELFKGPYITFWQSAGLLLLSHILLHACPMSRRGPGKWKREHWRKHWERKLASMTPEEREKFKSEWKNRCGWSGGWGGDWQQYMGYATMSPEEREQFKQEMKRWWIECATMTPEEKEKFKDDMKKRWGWKPEGE